VLREGLRHNWLLPTIPGTRYVTVGGALANNIHGKNCFNLGNIGEWVLSFSIMLASGDLLECTRTENSDLFHAAIGGQGLLGVILTASIQMIRTPSQFVDVHEIVGDSLAAIMSSMESAREGTDFMIARLDPFAPAPHRGRGILSLGKIVTSPPGARSAEFALDGHELSRYVFNVVPIAWSPPILKVTFGRSVAHLAASLDFRSVGRFSRGRSFRESNSAYSFPMDRRLPLYNEYFRHGHFQYQPLLPKENVATLVDEIIGMTQDCGNPSIMSGLKLHPKSRNDFPLSFDLNGYSITLDFPKKPSNVGELKALLRALNDLVVHAGGRIYLAKNSPVDRLTLAKMYPRLEFFERVKAQYDPRTLFQSDFYRRIFRGDARSEKYEELHL
jgi:FAD/FMN-containing dehydrogenase